MRLFTLLALLLLLLSSGLMAIQDGSASKHPESKLQVTVQILPLQNEIELPQDMNVPMEVSIRIHDDQKALVWEHVKSDKVYTGKPIHLQVRGKNLTLYAQLFAMETENDTYILTVHVQLWLQNMEHQKGVYRNFSKSVRVQENVPVEIFPLGTSSDESGSSSSFFDQLFNRRDTTEQQIESQGNERVENSRAHHLSIQIIVGN